VTVSGTSLKHLWYGDDFTGASDTLATFASAGLRALLFLGVPSAQQLQAAGPLDVLGIAGAARAMDPATMTEELEPVGRFAARLKVPVLHYKCCSTFDSSPDVGSLGAALRVLRPHVRNSFIPVVGGQPSLGRYCTFGNLFAAAGAGGEVYRIDRHPTMSRHPVTPMHEADLRRHLAAQGMADIGLIDFRLLDSADASALDNAVNVQAGAGTGDIDAVLFDVTRHAHLTSIGRAIWNCATRAPLLALGASSVAEALILHWRATGDLPAAVPTPSIAPAKGPVFLLAGSQSPVTAGQVADALAPGEATGPAYRGLTIDVAEIVQSPSALDAAAQNCAYLLNDGHSVLAQTGAVRDDGPPKLDVARACGRLLAQVLERAPAIGRVGVAGGDTSSMAVDALGIWALGYVGTLSPGVTLARAHAEAPRMNGLELMLKGGQMGSLDLFRRLLTGTA
jgi:uncharacterized protein YgbK (DUF1537 family)